MRIKTYTHAELKEARKYGDWRNGIDDFFDNCMDETSDFVKGAMGVLLGTLIIKSGIGLYSFIGLMDKAITAYATNPENIEVAKQLFQTISNNMPV